MPVYYSIINIHNTEQISFILAGYHGYIHTLHEISTMLEPAMISHSYEEPISYARPLGPFPKIVFSIQINLGGCSQQVLSVH